ncbi:uncharacterized protein LOC129598058 [Paramacrobiotus metropolitanus]|uniref:uncharacterized protein LOC129598058 n=1 Tax=Paramacrobiotus metropolitanus TaxID=2943436 RepID=UPI0024456616|nr:uncharacterized protein LOC129598058 [Paramacrobiotus metropolitanus]
MTGLVRGYLFLQTIWIVEITGRPYLDGPVASFSGPSYGGFVANPSYFRLNYNGSRPAYSNGYYEPTGPEEEDDYYGNDNMRNYNRDSPRRYQSRNKPRYDADYDWLRERFNKYYRNKFRRPRCQHHHSDDEDDGLDGFFRFFLCNEYWTTTTPAPEEDSTVADTTTAAPVESTTAVETGIIRAKEIYLDNGRWWIHDEFFNGKHYLVFRDTKNPTVNSNDNRVAFQEGMGTKNTLTA